MNAIEQCFEIEAAEAAQDAPIVRYVYEIARLQTWLSSPQTFRRSYAAHRIDIAQLFIDAHDALL